MKDISIFIKCGIMLTMCLILCSETIYSQDVLPDYLISKQKGNKVLVKWEPKSIDEWKSGMKNGVEVSLYNSNNNLLIESKVVKPLDYQTMERIVPKNNGFKAQFYQGALQLMYPEKVTDEDQKLGRALAGQSQAFIDSFRLGFIVYTGLFDFQLAESIGIATSFNAAPSNTYKVVINVGGQSYTTITDKDDQNKLSAMAGKWGNKNVELSWPTAGQEKKYYGYILQRSDDGIRYFQKDSLPYVNNIKSTGKEVATMIVRDSFPINYKNYYYQIRGFDYFGDYSTVVSGTMGYGFEIMTLSPMITFADQTEDNSGHIKWDVLGKDHHLLSHFRILRADTVDANYTVTVDSISKNNREIFFPLTSTTNFFRIEAVPKDGEAMSSIPVLIMGQDLDPPARPIILSATLEKGGVATIKWKKT